MNAIPSNKCGNIVDAKMWICSVSSIHNKAYFCFLSYFKFMDACVFVRVVLSSLLSTFANANNLIFYLPGIPWLSRVLESKSFPDLVDHRQGVV